MAAAIRASVAAQQQEESHRAEDREEGSRSKKEEAASRVPEESRGPRRLPRTQGEGAGSKEASTNGPVSQEAFPATGPVVASSNTLPPPNPKLKDEDFPSLCASTSSCCTAVTPGSVGLALAYPGPPRGKNTFQEEDFPALVSSVPKLSNAPSSLISAWNNSCSKKGNPPAGSQAVVGGSQPSRKAGKGSRGGRKGGPAPVDEEEGGGLTVQELRSVPTTVAVSSLLAPAANQSSAKVGKKKKVGSEKPGATSSPLLPPDHTPKLSGAEQVPEAPLSKVEVPVTIVVNGHSEGSTPARNTPKEPPGLPRPLGPLPCPIPQEDFPALGGPCPPRMPPPPGFSTVLLLKGTPPPPPPPPGLVPPVSKPPPGFSSFLPGSHPACVPSPTTTMKAPRLAPTPRAYLVPENFRERNLQLIQSIKGFLQSDEASFSEFKSHSGEFRQGMISAAQYYKSCRDLLGENFQKIFSELLALLPDTAKQQELLSAHTDFRSREKPPSSKSKKNKKNAWQTNTQQLGLDCCVCPTCQQVLAHGDISSHQALHAARDDDFPSLQAIARIIT